MATAFNTSFLQSIGISGGCRFWQAFMEPNSVVPDVVFNSLIQPDDLGWNTSAFVLSNDVVYGRHFALSDIAEAGIPPHLMSTPLADVDPGHFDAMTTTTLEGGLEAMSAAEDDSGMEEPISAGGSETREGIIATYEDAVSSGRPLGRFWKGEAGRLHARVLTRYVLEGKCGLMMDEESRRIDPRLTRDRYGEFLQAEGVSNWLDLFSKYRLKGMLLYALSSPNSVVELFEIAYPWAFDLGTPEGEHIHLIDFPRLPKIKTADDRAKRVREFRHVLEKHMGLEMRMGTGERPPFIAPDLFRGRQEAFLRRHGVGRWYDMMNKFGAAGLIRGEDYDDSFCLTLEEAYPWAFDLGTPEGRHLHPWDFSPMGHWKKKENRIQAIRHVFEAHLGLTITPEMVSPELLTPDGIDGLFRREGVAGWKELFERHGISRALDFYDAGDRAYSQAASALAEAYPFVFDLESEEGRHLHPWMFPTRGPGNWIGPMGRENARRYTSHVLERHLGLLDVPGHRIHPDLHPRRMPKVFRREGVMGWLGLMEKFGLHGMFRILFHSRPKEMLEEIFPWAFDLSTEEGNHLHGWQFVEEGRWERTAESDAMIRAAMHHIAVAHRHLPLEREAIRRDLTRQVLYAEGMPKPMMRDRFNYRLAALFHLAFPEIFPAGQAIGDWLEYIRTEFVQWEKVPRDIKQMFVWLLSQQADREMDMLTTRDFQRPVAAFGGKNLTGLLRSYGKKGMGDREALAELKRGLRIFPEERSFQRWLSKFSRGDMQWGHVPDGVRAEFLLFLASRAGKGVLELSTYDFFRHFEFLGDKCFGGLLSCYFTGTTRPKVALIRLLRVLVDRHRETIFLVRQDDMVRERLVRRGGAIFVSLGRRAMQWAIAYFNPDYFDSREVIGATQLLFRAAKSGRHPLDDVIEDAIMPEIASFLIMLALIDAEDKSRSKSAHEHEV